MTIKILFLTANPEDTSRLRLDLEVRAIDQALQKAEYRDIFDMRQHWATRVIDIQGYLLRHKPNIVHFSGHGNSRNEIVLEDGQGKSQPVPTDALGKLFELLKDNIKCVILNACYSEGQAQAIVNHIDCVIGMSEKIGDYAAISFSAAFYQALGYGRDVKTAFELGCVQIGLENLTGQYTPKILTRKSDSSDIVFFSGVKASPDLNFPQVVSLKSPQNSGKSAQLEFEASQLASKVRKILSKPSRRISELEDALVEIESALYNFSDSTSKHNNILSRAWFRTPES